MDYKIITPMMLWQDFNPTSKPLEVTILNMSSTDSILVKEVVFTAETASDGKVRAYAKMILQKGVENAPTLLYLPSADNDVSAGIFLEMALQNNYNMVIIDYSGFVEGKEHFTTYPESLKYCNYADYRKEAYKPTIAKETPWFVWIKVIRRAITLISEESSVDNKRIALLGYLEGAQLAWQVAGIDGRIKAVVPIGGSGYLEYNNQFKYAENNNIEMTEALECWLAGISPQTYARMITCPVLYLAGTNSTYADIDRLNDLFSLIPSDKKYLSLSMGTNHNIAKSTFDALFKWLDKYLINDEEAVIQPKLTVSVSDGMLYADIVNIKDGEDIDIYCAYDEVNPAYRSWVANKSPITVSENECIAPIKIFNDTKRVFIYANVTYKDGLVLSTHQIVVPIDTEKITVFDKKSNVKGRIIYMSSSESLPFTIENDYPVVDDKALVIENGPDDIKGVGVLSGRLCTYQLEVPENGDESDFILQMDVYSATPRTIKLNFYTAEADMKIYSININLTDTEHWERVNIESKDCKSSDMKSLKDWRIVKKLEITNAEKVLFNNILWV